MKFLKLIKKILFFKKKDDNSQYLNYFQNFSGMSDEITYNVLLKNLNQINNTSQTQNKIQFCNIPFNYTVRETLSKLGQPRMLIKHNNIQNITSLFYRKKLDNNKATMHFCFYKEKFIFGSWIFDRTDKLFTKEAEQAICKKYLLKNISDTMIAVVFDENHNMLEVKNEVDFRINYYTGDQEILLQINFQKIEEQNKKIQKTYQEMDKFI